MSFTACALGEREGERLSRGRRLVGRDMLTHKTVQINNADQLTPRYYYSAIVFRAQLDGKKAQPPRIKRRAQTTKPLI